MLMAAGASLTAREREVVGRVLVGKTYVVMEGEGEGEGEGENRGRIAI